MKKPPLERKWWQERGWCCCFNGRLGQHCEHCFWDKLAKSMRAADDPLRQEIMEASR